MNKIMKEGCLAIIVALIIIFGLSCLGAWGFMLLWNWIMPVLWSTCPILTFWQSFGILLIIDIIGFFFRGSSSYSKD